MKATELSVKGQVNSIQTLGTLDGPGVRFVVFMQGCNLRCSCCHNPETWEFTAGKPPSELEKLGVKEYYPAELLRMALRYRSYFGRDGGVTLTGGEPLMQAEFAYEFFRLCHESGIGTCLDTSGDLWNDWVERLIGETDRVLLDVKYHTDELYRAHVGCGISAPLRFLSELSRRGVPVTLRQVLIPGLNDNPENAEFICSLIRENKVIDKAEVLPFRRLCQVKYDKMGIEFPFAKVESPTPESVREMQEQFDACISGR